MKVLIFGASGMVGSGVLRQCLRDDSITEVLTVGRTPSGQQHAKLRELAHADMWNYADIEAQLTGYDACFFCLGVSAGGMPPEEYERLTYGIALAAGSTLARLNPAMRFLYISGSGTDSTERGTSRWARVKGKTENHLLALPFKAVMFRPGAIVPMHGEVSKTRAYRLFYTLFKPLLPLMRRLLPSVVTTTEELARAMISVARLGGTASIVEARDIGKLARR